MDANGREREVSSTRLFAWSAGMIFRSRFSFSRRVCLSVKVKLAGVLRLMVAGSRLLIRQGVPVTNPCALKDK